MNYWPQKLNKKKLCLAVCCYRRSNKSPTNLLVVPHRAMPRSSSAPDVRGVKGQFLLRWEVKGHGQWAVTCVILSVQCPSLLSRLDSRHLNPPSSSTLHVQWNLSFTGSLGYKNLSRCKREIAANDRP